MDERRYRVALLFDYITSEYSNLLLDGVKEACKKNDIELLVLPIGEMHNVEVAFDYQNLAVAGLLKSSNVDGIIFASGTQMHYLTKSELSSLIKSYKPIPVLSISVEVPGVPSIIVDSARAYKSLIDNLVKIQKCKKFGIMSVRSNSAEVKIRNKLIKEILHKHGIAQENIHLWKAKFDYGSTRNELDAYYEAHKKFDFDAIIALNDEMAFACIDFCRDHKFSVPDDIVVTGFDDIDRDKFASPSLTTINQQVFQQGFLAATTMKDIIDGKNVPKVQLIESKAVLRKSTFKNFGDVKENDFIVIDRDLEHHNIEGATEWYRKKNQLAHINNYYSEIQYDMSQEQLQRRLNSDMQTFGLSGMAVVLYENPIEMAAPFDYFTMPKKARVFSAYDYFTGFDSNKAEKIKPFNPSHNFLPEGIMKVDGEGVYVVSLFHTTFQFGYIVFRRGSYDIAIYDLLAKIVSSIISSVYSFALVNNENTKFQQKYDKLDIIANTDELTGLSNRRGLYEKGQTTLQFAEAMNQKGLIVYSDMDGLKKINDAYGHEAGDKAILAESIILKGNFRSNDIVARMGGDEFVMLCPGLTKEAFARIRKHIDEDCKKWSETSKAPFTLSVSMGCVEYPNEKIGYQLTPLLSEADSFLYMEKRRKKNGRK